MNWSTKSCGQLEGGHSSSYSCLYGGLDDKELVRLPQSVPVYTS